MGKREIVVTREVSFPIYILTGQDYRDTSHNPASSDFRRCQSNYFGVIRQTAVILEKIKASLWKPNTPSRLEVSRKFVHFLVCSIPSLLDVVYRLRAEGRTNTKHHTEILPAIAVVRSLENQQGVSRSSNCRYAEPSRSSLEYVPISGHLR